MATFPTLKAGDTIGIMAPSSRTDPERVDLAVKTLESMGYKVKVHPQTFSTYSLPDGTLTSSAGTAAEKVSALYDLWADPDVKAIMSARGGNEAAEMLPLLDFQKLAATPKILIGFSDITALLLPITRNSQVITFHGPMLNSLQGMDQGHLSQCFRVLSGHEKNISMNGAQTLQPGTATGHLVGGNLSVLCSLLGTPYQADFKDSILFIEDIGDELSRINRYLLQLKLAGIFNQISGLIVGDFSDLGDTGRLAFGRQVVDMIRHHTQGTSFPIVMDAPFGHQDKLVTMPVGAKAELKASQAPVLLLL